MLRQRDARSLLVVPFLLLLPASAHARGLVHLPAPWHRPALSDTTLAIEFGLASTTGDTSGVVLDGSLAPVRKGPLRLGFSWSFVWVRGAHGEAFGFGDPLAFARLRVFGSPETRAGFHLEGMARIPTADPELFPYASGAQELELAATLGLGRRRDSYLGAGYIWSEPRGDLSRSDVPHAIHGYGAVAFRRGHWVLRARGDAFYMEGDRTRGEAEASVTVLAPEALHPTLVVGAGFGGQDDRAYDILVALRFAMNLR